MIRWSLFAIALTLAASPALAATPIESDYFPAPNLNLEARWLLPNTQLDTDPTLAHTAIAQSGFTELRLFIPPEFIGKPIRIAMTVPTSTEGIRAANAFEVEWRSQGVYLAGSTRPGGRVLFFEGVVDSSPLRGLIDYTFRIDARAADTSIRFEPQYEIE